MREIARALHALHAARPHPFDRSLVGPWAQAHMELLFPEWAPSRLDEVGLEERLHGLARLSQQLLGACFAFEAPLCADRAGAEMQAAIEGLPRLQALLHEDARALQAFDPAARSLDEVILCYPGLHATALHRVAHDLHARGLRLPARLLAAHAHERTGIDIHPGARIGRSFCIDHGSGVVIGETAVIGDRVKLYQGVTLGALSVAKALEGKKRHPTIEDDCVVYANATILGGETVVGRGSTIGGNVWLTRSVPPGSVIDYQRERAGPRREPGGTDA